ncbi:MAG: hypothetical protein HC811_03020 [Flammeovirgaceae bacterium]|nr:hypothetical protein [Flammeovirgaceae bacterium]
MKRLFFILLFIPLALAAQEDILPVEMELKYLQRDTNFELTASLVDEDGEPVKGVDVLFTAHVNGSSNTLGTAVTNPNGVAIIKKELKHFESSAINSILRQFLLVIPHMMQHQVKLTSPMFR